MGRNYSKCSFPCSVKIVGCNFIRVFYFNVKHMKHFHHDCDIFCANRQYFFINRVFCPRAGLPLQTRAAWLQFCPKAGLPPQTQEPRLQFYYGWMNRCGSFPFLCASHSLFSIRTEFKWCEKIPGAPPWTWGAWIWQSGPSGLDRNSPQRLNINFIRVFDQIRDLEIPIILRPQGHDRGLKFLKVIGPMWKF